ncbi:hypothetical protein DUNSADRAFT_9689 [Dunaliella salina]|uniref:Uncharacterized protein n=1 Tax=Dunaliella salina TaxID=3046 RepID=A0ABQ7GGX9_DUNSA|nr:hypothetical protein DUNSADRAFT_9689 [Dunaliella salina]|eukprot:KAF5833852.1 hypothetical protein DUNSADRAFT_9689 [Dunaliella salina]
MLTTLSISSLCLCHSIPLCRCHCLECAALLAHHCCVLVLQPQADELLERLEASEAMQSQMSVRLDRACCAVLLGRAPSHSLQLLGMPEVLQAAAARAGGRGLKGASATVRMHGNATISSQDGPDWEACQYVMDRSPDAPDDMAPGLHALMKGWLCEAVLGGLREWQRPAAPPMATVTSAAATPSIPSQLSCLLTATAADSCTADIVGNQAAVTPAGSAARGGKNAPVLATVVTSQLQAYWFTKPLVALYAKAYPIARLLPPLLATLHFLCTCSERVATALAALMSRSAAHAHRHAQRRDAARAQAAREHDVRVKAAAEEAVAYRRQQELQWRMEAEAEALWGSAEGDGGGEEGGGSAGHVGEAGHASEMESVRARLGMGMVEEEGVALPSPPSSGMRARSAGGSGMGRGGQGSPDEGEWVEAVGAVHHGSGGGDGAGAEGKVSRGPRGGDGWVGGSASGAAATALAPCDVLQQQQQQQRQQQPLLRQGHQLQQPDDEEEEDASRARAVQSQLMEMERAMWDSGAHVRMQKLMEDFQSKAATNTMMSRAGGPRAPPSPLPPLHVFLPSVALTVAATTAAVLGVFGHGWGQSGLPATVAGVNVGAAATAVQEAPALRKGWGRGV